MPIGNRGINTLIDSMKEYPKIEEPVVEPRPMSTHSYLTQLSLGKNAVTTLKVGHVNYLGIYTHNGGIVIRCRDKKDVTYRYEALLEGYYIKCILQKHKNELMKLAKKNELKFKKEAV